MLQPGVKARSAAAPGNVPPQSPSPCKGGTNSIPRIPFIDRPFVLRAESAVLRLEILLSVVLGLAVDVFLDWLDLNRADAEFAVSGLPREIGIPRVEGFDPTGGRTLDLLDNLCGRVVLGLPEQDVDVVCHRVDFDERRIVVFENASNVGVELAAFTVAEEWATILGAETEVDDDVG